MEITASVIAVLLMLVGITGIIVPVLPGSALIIATLLVWALVVADATGWVVFAIGAVLCGTGMVATYVMTGRVLRREKIPNRSVVIGMVAGVVGMFVLPAFGLPIGFVAGLLASEYLRQRDWSRATSSSWQAIKATGLGIVVEFFCAATVLVVFLVGLLVRFL